MEIPISSSLMARPGAYRACPQLHFFLASLRSSSVPSTSYAAPQRRSLHSASALTARPAGLRTQPTYSQRLIVATALEANSTVTGMSPDLKEALDNFINQHKIVLFMKGTKQFPQCGFSNTCVQIFNMMKVPYETVNILEDDLLRTGMKEYSQWPTFPQVYINGEFFGGCDIMIESFQKGELPEILEAASLS